MTDAERVQKWAARLKQLVDIYERHARVAYAQTDTRSYGTYKSVAHDIRELLREEV